MTPQDPSSLYNSFRSWFGESVLIKLFLIGVLTLILLIPSVAIQDLIRERQARQEEATSEISDKWSGKQEVAGPVMVLPYKTTIGTRDTTGKMTYREAITNICILPEILNIKSNASPEVLHRGIFDAVVYNSAVSFSGKFAPLELKKSGINPAMIQWDKARLVVGVSDLKGLRSNPSIRLGEHTYEVEPDFSPLKLFANNLMIMPGLTPEEGTALPFSFNLNLRGSSALSFVQLGKTTTATLSGNWNNPKFIGRTLPDNRNISSGTFSAGWNLPYFSRPFPQQWIQENTASKTLNEEAAFGVEFILPVDQYQKTMRSAKYSMLIILLSFIALIFTELLTKRKVHLLQYILIGAAMIIYYTLLLSFSERWGFSIAYLVASLATVALITSFITALLRNKKASLVFGSILAVFYSFIYVIIQLQDLALLFGSIGLFIITAVLMYLSAKIDLYKRSLPQDEAAVS